MAPVIIEEPGCVGRGKALSLEFCFRYPLSAEDSREVGSREYGAIDAGGSIPDWMAGAHLRQPSGQAAGVPGGSLESDQGASHPRPSAACGWPSLCCDLECGSGPVCDGLPGAADAVRFRCSGPGDGHLAGFVGTWCDSLGSGSGDIRGFRMARTVECVGRSSGSVCLLRSGILASKDPVAIDQASVDLVNQEPALADACLKTNTGPGEDKFMGVYPKVDWRIQLEYAEKIGLGSCAYTLEML